MGGARNFSGGKTLKKVISFDHFTQENAHFFFISLKVGRANWCGRLFLFEEMPPLPSPVMLPLILNLEIKKLKLTIHYEMVNHISKHDLDIVPHQNPK